MTTFEEALDEYFKDPDFCERHQTGALYQFCDYCALEAIEEIREIHGEQSTSTGEARCKTCKRPYPCATYRATIEAKGLVGHRIVREKRTLSTEPRVYE